jgi:cyclophilin family peptidyl-prolyl cis-trans isomerase
MGKAVIDLHWKQVSVTYRNFAELVKRNCYNGTKFHRNIRDFMVQDKLTLSMSQLKRFA